MREPTLDSSPKPAPGAAQGRGVNWSRFWMQMLVAIVVFNILAALVTWFFIFPKLGLR